MEFFSESRFSALTQFGIISLFSTALTVKDNLGRIYIKSMYSQINFRLNMT